MCTWRHFRRTEGGDPGEDGRESPEGAGGQSGLSLNDKDRTYNRRGKWNGDIQFCGWGQLSEECWDTITQRERGPLGTGRPLNI